MEWLFWGLILVFGGAAFFTKVWPEIRKVLDKRKERE